MKLSVKTVKPSDFEVGDHLWNSFLKDSNKEDIARNIILISLWDNDQWTSFTWEEYQQKCGYQASDYEKDILDYFVSDCLIKCEDGVYSVQDDFIKILQQFIKH